MLFALKAMYPSRVFLIRGNHEFRQQNEAMAEAGFLYHVKSRLPSTWHQVYESAHETIDWRALSQALPLTLPPTPTPGLRERP